MIHLHIANKIATIHPELIKSPSQFYLGALAPDSVHFRTEFIANEKKITHLCDSDENWGEVTDNERWTTSVIAFLHEHKDSDNSCFALGYVVHILSDIYNNIHIWTPYRKSVNMQMNISKYYGSSYHKEQAMVDFRLALELEDKKSVWESLETAIAITMPNIVYAKDIEKLRENILYVQYENITDTDTTKNEIYTYQNALTQIENTTKFISQTLTAHLN